MAERMNPSFPIRPIGVKKGNLFLSLALGVLAFIQVLSGQVVGFEPGAGYQSGADISTYPAWVKSTPGVAQISSDEAKSGTQSLKIVALTTDQPVTTGLTIPSNGILFFDFVILPTVDASSAPEGIVNANGAVIGFVKSQNQGTVVAVTSSESSTGLSNSVDTGATFAIDSNNLAADWVRVTVREDLKAGKWDLYVNGILLLFDQQLAVSTSRRAPAVLSLYPSPAGSSFVDDLSVSGQNPLFPDADEDGIPDAVETAMGSNPLVNDRGSYSPAGVTYLQLFQKISSGYTTTTGSAFRIIYVDGQIGNDQETGALSYRVKGRGPKATIGSAVQSADSNTIIAIAADANYTWPGNILNAKAGTINLLPLGDIDLQ